MLATHLEDIYNYIKANIKEEEKEDDVNVNIEIPPKILQDIMDNSRKRKADGSIDCRASKSSCGYSPEEDILGDRKDKLEEYYNWTLSQVTSDRWRMELEAASQFAMEEFLELNSILQHQKLIFDLMVRGGIKPGIAL